MQFSPWAEYSGLAHGSGPSFVRRRFPIFPKLAATSRSLCLLNSFLLFLNFNHLIWSVEGIFNPYAISSTLVSQLLLLFKFLSATSSTSSRVSGSQ
ncbi:hypothetical protein L6452_16533 [Arctium lappa]|uniref:Uncharacterized protein n=1 Tax=Arctium lappa TaxID=4217 RepID=A0ACB9C0Q8_ARCLA|nr:hypothetical protein L6452_16533 [Arctium lappa]